MEPDADVDAMVADVVRSVRDRFGAEGLRDLVALANSEIDRSERALADLVALDVPAVLRDPEPDAADTQAWIAYTAEEPEPEPELDADADD